MLLSQSGGAADQPKGVQYAQAGEFTPEQLAEARRMIANGQNPHPGVSPGIGHEKDWVGPLFAEEYAKGYARTTIGLAAGELGPEAAAAARTPFGRALLRDFGNNLVLGFGEGQALTARTGPVGFTPAARIGFEVGYAAGLSQSRLASGIRALLGP